MKIVLNAAIAATLLAGCSNENPAKLQAVTVPTTVSKGVKEVVETSWPKAIKACPGLVKYAGDLTFNGVEDNYSIAPAHAQRIEVMYRVAETPKYVPAEYRTSGHMCFFSLSPDGSTLSISKSACANLCLDSTNGTSDVTIPL